ncbi:MAG: N-6 DNA methylase [Termitinemataceae bacterium]|nr:MAG: N-6 DNA methylase [Termitinemataceae bacterium]
MTTVKQKVTGSFYTESKVAESLVNWAILNGKDRVLEPSFGGGIFIDKSICRFRTLGNFNPSITAVEIQPEVVEYVRKQFNIRNLHTLTTDFLSLDLINQFDAVVGNPPYVGIKNLSSEQKNTARQVIKNYSVQCPDNGSLWFPFVLHAITTIKANGRLAFVLPFEITYTRYAYGLWKILSQNFSNLSICRIYEDFFPNVDIEAILLFAEGKGGKTTHIKYNTYNTVDDFMKEKVSKCQQIELSDIVSNNKPFISSLLTSMQQQLLQGLENRGIIKPIIESCKFKIGYVSADKDYFHPNASLIAQYSIPKINLYPAILNAKEINGGTGIGIEVSKGECSSALYLPKKITDGDRRYIQKGEDMLVHQRYKCRQRKPWYVTPDVEIPDVILSVFGEIPKLIANKGNYAVSNSLLCGHLKGIPAKQLLCRWYNSLTLLSLELNVHSLGGGSFVIIPGEADRLKIISDIPQKNVQNIFTQLNKVTKELNVEAAYALGDKIVLQEIYDMSDNDIKIIREAIQILRKWRNPAKRRM